MTDRDALLALAERCEKATGPDRELDVDIDCALFPDATHIAGTITYTASIDAAMTLVPEGWETAIYLGGELVNVQMETEAMRQTMIDFYPIDAIAATAALALCAAAFRAKSHA